eukprot:TRINITY_DN94367_c0_g1_i1.p1 TRINITY_DN94367_c0_g1~~TRINITY_DN94367_c0_g1_i1.p1  ORF type:complete len:616 (+),score=209.34 TRINITY_DN94367_c0_g1_i1:120-1967(+)
MDQEAKPSNVSTPAGRSPSSLQAKKVFKRSRCDEDHDPKQKSYELLQRYPEHIPIVIVSVDKKHKKKLLTPLSFSGIELTKTARDKCADFVKPKDRLHFLNGTMLPDWGKLLDSYQAHKSKDNFLYLVFAPERKFEDDFPSWPSTPKAKEGSGSKSSKEKPSSGPQSFHIPDNDPASKDSRDAKKVIAKHPDRVPVLIRQSETDGLPKLEKRLLVPDNMSVNELKSILPAYLKISDMMTPKEAREKLVLLAAGDKLEPNLLMSDVYDEHQDDKCLYINVAIASVEKDEVEDIIEETESDEDEDDEVISDRKTDEMKVPFSDLKAAEEKALAAEEKALSQMERAAAAEEKALASELKVLEAEEQILMLREAQESSGVQDGEIWELREEVEAAEEARQLAEDKAKLAQEEKQVMEEKVTEAEKKVEALEDKVSELHQDIETMKVDTKTASDIAELSANEIKTLQSSLTAKCDAIKSLEEEYERLEGSLADEKKGRRVAEDDLASTKKLLEAKAEEFASAEMCQKWLQTRVDQLQKEGEVKAMAIERTTKVMEDKLAAMEKAKEAALKKAEEQAKKIAQLEAQISKMEKDDFIHIDFGSAGERPDEDGFEVLAAGQSN